MKIRVLLVDDEEQYADALAERFQARGLDAATAYSGDEALARLQDGEFDVVILDMVMPGKDGIETLNEIKQLRPLVEVILLTGFATLDTAVSSLQRGAFYYLMKPADMRDLLQSILNAYKRKAEHEERIRQAEIKRLTVMLAGEM
ncbi:MAG TPA: two-component system response regulator [Syntrophobacteraceae bacterium]|nr:two-component system response regulator [Syntrophobacteraceae bacterium]